MQDSVFTKTFWKDAAERSIKTGAQFVALVFFAGLVAGGQPGETAETINALALDWLTIFGTFLGGAFFSLITSLGSAAAGQRGTASLTSAVKPAE